MKAVSSRWWSCSRCQRFQMRKVLRRCPGMPRQMPRSKSPQKYSTSSSWLPPPSPSPQIVYRPRPSQRPSPPSRLPLSPIGSPSQSWWQFFRVPFRLGRWSCACVSGILGSLTISVRLPCYSQHWLHRRAREYFLPLHRFEPDALSFELFWGPGRYWWRETRGGREPAGRGIWWR